MEVSGLEGTGTALEGREVEVGRCELVEVVEEEGREVVGVERA